MKTLMIMTKIAEILSNATFALSGSYVSSNKYYLDFLSNYNSGKICFGGLYEDRVNYSRDISNVFKDYKRASLNYRESKRKKSWRDGKGK